MGEKISHILNIIIDFCKDNQSILMIAGAALIVLIVLIAIIRSLTKKDGDDDLDFDEEEFFADIAPKTAAAPADKPEKSEDKPADEPKESIAKAVVAEPVQTVNTNQGTPSVVQSTPLEISSLAARMKTDTMNLEGILTELAELSSRGLSEIEIKISEAEVKLKYGGRELLTKSRRDDDERESALSTSNTVKAAEIVDKAKEATEVKEVEEAPYAETAEALSFEELLGVTPVSLDGLLGQEPKEESNEESVSGREIRKFGPENIDTTRSGRIFTEEELNKQIRD